MAAGGAVVAMGLPIPTTLQDFFQPGTQPVGAQDVAHADAVPGGLVRIGGADSAPGCAYGPSFFAGVLLGAV